MNFDRISRHIRSIRNYFYFVHKMAAGGHFENHFPSHILDDRKSLLITFLAISYQYATLIFFFKFSQHGCRRPFWMTENHFRMHFSSFQINTQVLFLKKKIKWPPAAILEVRFGPFWMTENHFSIAFLAISFLRQLFFFNSFSKWPPAAILEIQMRSSTMCYQWLCQI